MTAPPDRGGSAATGSDSGRRVFSESMFYIAIDAAQNLLALLVVPVSLWWLTPADMGTVTLAIIGTQIAMTVAAVGLDFAVVRYYLSWPERDRSGQVAGVLAVVVAVSAVIVIGTTLAAPGAGADVAVVLASISAGAGLAVRSIPLAVFRVTSDLRRYATIVVSGSLLQAALQIGLLVMGSGLVGFLFGASAAAGLSAIIACALLGRAGHLASVRRPDPAVWRVSGWVFVSSLVNRLVTNADRFAVGWWGTLDTLGVYGTAARWTMPLRMVSSGAKMAIAPALSRAETEGGPLESASAPIAALVTLLALLAALLQVSSTSLLLTPWQPFASEFQRLLSVLLAAQLAGSLALIGQLFLYYVGRSAHSAGLSVLSATVTLAGLFWLVPKFGALGAAIAQLAASLVMLTALCFAGGRVAWLSPRALRAIAVLAAGLAAPWILPAEGSALVTIAGTAVLAGWAWNDLRSTIQLRRLAG